MRTRNKAAKEQTTNRVRPKRGGNETPEPKTPVKQTTNSNSNSSSNSPLDKTTSNATPAKKKGKSEKLETLSKSRKRTQEKTDDTELDEKDLGLFKKNVNEQKVHLA